MRTKIVIAILVVGSLAVLFGAMQGKHQSDKAERVLRAGQEIKIGMRLDEARRVFSASGATLSPPHDCEADDCQESFVIENTILRRMRLAPPTLLMVVLRSRDEAVAGLNVSYITQADGTNYAALIRMIDPRDLPPPEGQALAIPTSRLMKDGHLKERVLVILNNESSPSDRQKAFALNTACLSKMRGCRDSAEMAPSLW